MAAQLLLSDGTTSINLTNSTGFQASDPYLQTLPIPTGDGSIPAYTIEVIPCYINITSDNNLAATLQDFHALQLVAAEYWQDPDQNTPVWFTRQLTAESSATRTLVRSLAFEPSNDPVGSWVEVAPAISGGRFGTLTVEHHPYNEASSATTAAGATIDYLGGTKTINSVPGDVLARISLLSFTGTQGMRWDNGVYIGIRSNGKNGVTIANLNTLWEAEDALNGGNTSDTAGGASDSGGNYVTMTTGGAAWTECSTFILDTFDGGNPTDHYGTFLIIVRAKLASNATSVSLRANLRSGGVIGGGGAIAAGFMSHTNEPVEVTGTDWESFNMGAVTFPMAGLKYTTPSYSALQERIVLEAYWNTGTASLLVDCLAIIPIDEAWLTLPKEASGYTTLAATDDYEFGVLPTDDHTPFAQLSSAGVSLYLPVPARSPSFGLRPGNNLLVYYTDVDPSVGDVTLAVDYVPRWASLRGAE
jgi:hypothetical protein